MAISEEQINLAPTGETSIPCSIWMQTEPPRGIVILGHGLGVDRFDATVMRPMELLVQDHHAAVVVPEIPLHGTRTELPYDTLEIVGRWQKFWISGGIDSICKELQLLTDFCIRRFDNVPITYFGASLGTQYGIPFLAQTKNIRSAVLGLFGSHPPPKTPVMNQFAPEVQCPVYFIQKLDDEIHSAESTTHLFSTIGALEKVIDSSSGRHGDVSMETVANACSFLAKHGRFHDA